MCRLVPEGSSRIVIASTGGETALSLANQLRDKSGNTVAVSHNVRYAHPNQDACSAFERRVLVSRDAKIFTVTILTRDIEAALMKKHRRGDPLLHRGPECEDAVSEYAGGGQDLVRHAMQ